MSQDLELNLSNALRRLGEKPSPDLIEALISRHPLLAKWRKLWEEIHGYRRAFVIEFAGMPKAGKSSTVDQVRHFFSHGHNHVKVGRKAPPYIVHTPAEGVSQRTPRTLKDDMVDYNAWAGAYALQELLEARHDRFHDIVLLDRGPWDAGCWLQYYKTHHEPGDNDVPVEALADFFQLPFWSTQADIHVVMLIQPEAALDRESKRLVSHKGPSSDSEMMKAMYDIYKESFETLIQKKAKGCEIVGIDSALLLETTDYKQNGAAEFEVIEQIFKVLEKKINDLQPKTATAKLSALTTAAAKVVREHDMNHFKNECTKLHSRINIMTPYRKFELKRSLDKIDDLVLTARGEWKPMIEAVSNYIDEAVQS